MSFELFSVIRSANPIDRDLDPEAYHRKEIELHNYLQFNIFTWPKLLDMARSYGWQTGGTLSGEIYCGRETIPDPDPEPSQWDGNYTTNEGQVVTAEDAAALASALEKALDDIPDQDEFTPKYIELSSNEVSREYIQSSGNLYLKAILESGLIGPRSDFFPNVMLTPCEYFGGQEKQLVIDLIAFCRRGAFQIF